MTETGDFSAGFSDGLRTGLANPAEDAQGIFRAALDAMSRPGTIVTLNQELAPPPPLGTATAAILLALADRDTPVWLGTSLSNPDISGFLRFHTGAAVTTSPGAAGFAVTEGVPDLPLDAFSLGEDEYPDRSTTLIMQVEDLSSDGPIVLTGPGIESGIGIGHRIQIGGVAKSFWSARSNLSAFFPRGLDLFFCSGNRLAALPRTTTAKITETGE